MRGDEQERELRRRFAALRAADAQTAPPFAVPVRAVPVRRVPLGLAAAAAVAAVALGGVWVSRRAAPDPFTVLGLEMDATSWISPTDFLLEIPTLGQLTGLAPDSLPGARTEFEPADTAIPEDLS